MGEIQDRKIHKRYILAISSLLIIVFLFGCLLWWVRANRFVSTDDARVKGTIVTVSPKISGRIKQILATEGDNVQEGQIIVTLESEELELQVSQATANLAAVKARLAVAKTGNRPQEIAQAWANLNQAQANLTNASKKNERSRELYHQGAMSAQQRDTDETAFDIAKAQYQSALQSYQLAAEGSREEDISYAEAQVAQAEAILKNAQLQLTNTVITAPVAGTIAIKATQAGEIVSSGQSLFLITNLNDVWIAANIEETHIGKIKVGQPVKLTIDAYSSREFSGKVSEVGSATSSQFSLLPAENSSGNFTKITQRLPIKIKALDASPGELKPGMSAIIQISIQ